MIANLQKIGRKAPRMLIGAEEQCVMCIKVCQPPTIKGFDAFKSVDDKWTRNSNHFKISLINARRKEQFPLAEMRIQRPLMLHVSQY